MVKIEDVVVEKEKGPLRNVFVEKIPLKILFDLLDKICSVIEGRGVEKGVRLFYYISEYEYRKMVFDRLHTEFLNSIRNYYSTFFSRYWEREFTYNAFKTILRQICKTHGIRYEKQSYVVNSEIVASYLIYV